MSLPIRALTKSGGSPPMSNQALSEKQVGSAPTSTLPSRQGTGMTNLSEASAVPTNDISETSAILEDRLRAWKHAVAYLEDYISATEKIHKAHAKEYEKVLKTVSDPLKEGHHFDQTLGGIAGMFENIRVNTEGLANSHLETEKNLKGSVLPILERLHKEIKNKSSEITNGVGKAAKAIEKSRNTTQKHIELLGQQTAGAESSAHKIHAHDDPYITQRGVYYRLNKQILEENNNRQDLLSVQENFAAFEHHIVEVIQQAMASFTQYVGGQATRTQNAYTDMLSTAQHIPPDFEWKGFVQRYHHSLVDPNAPNRSIESVSFPNQNHKATQPLVEGTLERKSRNILSGGYSTGYYAVTGAAYLHGFKDNDNLRRDPEPEISIYLPDAVIGAASGQKFNIKGKDVSKGLSSKLSGTSELHFKAHTPQDAEKWVEIIKMAAGSQASIVPYASAPGSPAVERREPSYGSMNAAAVGGAGSQQVSPQASIGGGQQQQIEQPHPVNVQTQGITGGEQVVSPVAASPPGQATVAGGPPMTGAAPVEKS